MVQKYSVTNDGILLNLQDFLMSGKFIVNSSVERDLIRWVASEYPDTRTNSLICSIFSMSALTRYSTDVVQDAIRDGSLFAFDARGYFTDADSRHGRAFRAISHFDTVMAWGDMKRLSVAAARQESAARLNGRFTEVGSGSAVVGGIMGQVDEKK